MVPYEKTSSHPFVFLQKLADFRKFPRPQMKVRSSDGTILILSTGSADIDTQTGISETATMPMARAKCGRTTNSVPLVTDLPIEDDNADKSGRDHMQIMTDHQHRARKSSVNLFKSLIKICGAA